VPIVVNTTSYDDAWSLLGNGKLTAAERTKASHRLKAETRPEEFLAALNYGFTPPAPGTLALRSAGGVSPFGTPQQRLLQVAAVAGSQTGKQPLIGEDVRLSVTFNPRAVARYRLIGHETNDLLGVLPQPSTVSLKAGEVATGLFEVELLGKGEESVANIELTWTVPEVGMIRRQTMRVSRWQLADSLLETPPSVQAAAIAAEAAEVFRHSYFASGREHSWSRIRQVATEMHPAVLAEPTVRRLLQLVRLADWQGIR
jgi:hypothetical protein